MTRLERAAEKVRKEEEKRTEEQRRAQEKDAAQAEAIRQAKAVERVEAKKALTRRRYAIGDLAERAGLFGWDNATLANLFALLATLAPCPNPVPVLEALLGSGGESLNERLLTAQGVFPSEVCTTPREKSPSSSPRLAAV